MSTALHLQPSGEEELCPAWLFSREELAVIEDRRRKSQVGQEGRRRRRSRRREENQEGHQSSMRYQIRHRLGE